MCIRGIILGSAFGILNCTFELLIHVLTINKISEIFKFNNIIIIFKISDFNCNNSPKESILHLFHRISVKLNLVLININLQI